MASTFANTSSRVYDYIVVGSGPGGGPLAANLARNGHSVLLLEAGDDQGQNLTAKIPGLFGMFEEDPQQRWDFFVKHYSDPKQAAKDSKMTWETPEGGIFVGSNPPTGSKQLGIYYPRAGTLGGCAQHNALVSLLPPDDEWQHIAQLTGDESWKPQEMRRLFVRTERCRYLPEGTPGHGFGGWFEQNLADKTTVETAEPILNRALAVLKTHLVQDSNGLHPESKDGVYRPVMSMTAEGRRCSPRNYLVATANAQNADGRKKFPLHIRTHCLATRVLFERASKQHHDLPKAVGVEFLEGQSMYRADPRFNDGNPGVKRTAYAKREVIVACGVFNTPQLLKLSGVGPKAELEKLGIDLVVDLPGVGTNLQDNYEYSVVSTTQQSLSPFSKGTGLTAGDPLLKQWITSGGPYASNGVPAFILATSSKSRTPDLLILTGAFKLTGFFPGFSRVIATTPNSWTWDVLKIGQHSTAGTVTLRSADPRDVPDINFRFFGDSNAADDPDVAAMAEGVAIARRVNAAVSGPPAGPLHEVEPGADAKTPAQVEQHVRDQAFSHHASGTCAIGPEGDRRACLDSRFRVRGTRGLRVVDASAFPRVVGAFPTLALCVVSEKATEVILEDVAKIGGADDKVLDGVRELEVLVEDARDNGIVFEQAALQDAAK